MHGTSSRNTRFCPVYWSVAKPDPYTCTIVPPAMLPSLGDIQYKATKII